MRRGQVGTQMNESLGFPLAVLGHILHLSYL